MKKSMQVRHGRDLKHMFHSFIKKSRVSFLNRCTHDLNDRTAPLAKNGIMKP